MTTIITKPVTPEYEESWNRVFGKKYQWKEYPKGAVDHLDPEVVKEYLNQPVFNSHHGDK